ncbi:MAG: polysaccharide export protein [Saprospiraceae bacterium]|nr:polysaccharide export protein [Pyrinomonadaceae bacterium]
MKIISLTKKIGLSFVLGLVFGCGLIAQPPAMSVQKAVNTDSKSNMPQTALSDEEAAILPYYTNYLREYHLGPEDVISVEVFGEAKYSKAGIIIPPTSRISYPLIRGGVFVGGKTTEQVAEEIKKKLDEYIIDPQVMVMLDKAGSARFSVLGKVAVPGVKIMNRRYNVYEAVAEAGGIATAGDKKRILLVRMNQQGGFTQTVINFDDLLSGKIEVPYLLPGDQIIVPEKKWSLTKVLDTIGRVGALRILLGTPF